MTFQEYRKICKDPDYLSTKNSFYSEYVAICLLMSAVASVFYLVKDIFGHNLIGNPTAITIAFIYRIVPAIIHIPAIIAAWKGNKYTTMFVNIVTWIEILSAFFGIHFLNVLVGYNTRCGWLAYYVIFYAFSVTTHHMWVFPANIGLLSIILMVAGHYDYVHMVIGEGAVVSTALFFSIPLWFTVYYFKKSFASYYVTNKEKIDLGKKDALTGAWNRFGLNDLTDTKGHLLKDCTLFLIDIDDFKIFNDLAGHDLGDEILKETVATANRITRAEDRIVRYGGDEFLLYIEGDVEPRSIYDRFMEERSIALKRNAVTYSIGAVKAKKEDNLYKAINHADEAMYAVKQTNKNNFCFFE